MYPKMNTNLCIGFLYLRIKKRGEYSPKQLHYDTLQETVTPKKRGKDIHMTGETWKDKLIELVNTYDTSEETLEICFWLIVQRIKRGK